MLHSILIYNVSIDSQNYILPWVECDFIHSFARIKDNRLRARFFWDLIYSFAFSSHSTGLRESADFRISKWSFVPPNDPLSPTLPKTVPNRTS
jgi:hypothetical protein